VITEGSKYQHPRVIPGILKVLLGTLFLLLLTGHASAATYSTSIDSPPILGVVPVDHTIPLDDTPGWSVNTRGGLGPDPISTGYLGTFGLTGQEYARSSELRAFAPVSSDTPYRLGFSLPGVSDGYRYTIGIPRNFQVTGHAEFVEMTLEVHGATVWESPRLTVQDYMDSLDTLMSGIDITDHITDSDVSDGSVVVTVRMVTLGCEEVDLKCVLAYWEHYTDSDYRPYGRAWSIDHAPINRLEVPIPATDGSDTLGALALDMVVVSHPSGANAIPDGLARNGISVSLNRSDGTELDISGDVTFEPVSVSDHYGNVLPASRLRWSASGYTENMVTVDPSLIVDAKDLVLYVPTSDLEVPLVWSLELVSAERATPTVIDHDIPLDLFPIIDGDGDDVGAFHDLIITPTGTVPTGSSIGFKPVVSCTLAEGAVGEPPRMNGFPLWSQPSTVAGAMVISSADPVGPADHGLPPVILSGNISAASCVLTIRTSTLSGEVEPTLESIGLTYSFMSEPSFDLTVTQGLGGWSEHLIGSGSSTVVRPLLSGTPVTFGLSSSLDTTSMSLTSVGDDSPFAQAQGVDGMVAIAAVPMDRFPLTLTINAGPFARAYTITAQVVEGPELNVITPPVGWKGVFNWSWSGTESLQSPSFSWELLRDDVVVASQDSSAVTPESFGHDVRLGGNYTLLASFNDTRDLGGVLAREYSVLDHPPVIQDISFGPYQLVAGVSGMVTINITDEDDDDVVVSWVLTREGEGSEILSGSSSTFGLALEGGDHVLTVEATDGEASSIVSTPVEILPWDELVFPSLVLEQISGSTDGSFSLDARTIPSTFDLPGLLSVASFDDPRITYQHGNLTFTPGPNDPVSYAPFELGLGGPMGASGSLDLTFAAGSWAYLSGVSDTSLLLTGGTQDMELFPNGLELSAAGMEFPSVEVSDVAVVSQETEGVGSTVAVSIVGQEDGTALHISDAPSLDPSIEGVRVRLVPPARIRVDVELTFSWGSRVTSVEIPVLFSSGHSLTAGHVEDGLSGREYNEGFTFAPGQRPLVIVGPSVEQVRWTGPLGSGSSVSMDGLPPGISGFPDPYSQVLVADMSHVGTWVLEAYDNGAVQDTLLFKVLDSSVSGNAGQGVDVMIIQGAVGVTLATISVLMLVLEELRRRFFLTFLMPLYTKLKPAEVFSHGTRMQVFGYITENPGAHFRDILGSLDLANGVVVYHLSVLEREGAIVSRKEGRLRRYLPSGRGVALPPALTGTQQQALVFIRDSPGLSQKELGELIGAPKQTVADVVKGLVDKGLVTKVKQGRSMTLFEVEQH